MDKKDLLGLELKSIMEEEAANINLSQSTINQILHARKTGFFYKIKDFLNREIEIPLAPGLIGLVSLIILLSIPKDLFKYEDKEIILMVDRPIILSSREVVRK